MMQRVDIPEILDSDTCPPGEVETSLRDLVRINSWFGGVATTAALVGRAAQRAGCKRLSLLEVAAGSGEVTRMVARRVARSGITLDVTLLDRARSHLFAGGRAVVSDGLALPFRENAFDLVSCNLFAHHLSPDNLRRFVTEALRVSREAVLINDLIRHPLHLAFVYAGFALMRSHVSRVDGVASVRRAYTPREIRDILTSVPLPAERIEISSHFLFRMGVIVWKEYPGEKLSRQRPGNPG